MTDKIEQVKQYRKKPVVIEAFQLTDEWFDAGIPNPLHIIGFITDPIHRWVQLPVEGEVIAIVGDWIVKDMNGEFYVYTPDVFEETFEPVAALSQPAEKTEGFKLTFNQDATLYTSGSNQFGVLNLADVGASQPAPVSEELLLTELNEIVGSIFVQAHNEAVVICSNDQMEIDSVKRSQYEKHTADEWASQILTKLQPLLDAKQGEIEELKTEVAMIKLNRDCIDSAYLDVSSDLKDREAEIAQLKKQVEGMGK